MTRHSRDKRRDSGGTRSRGEARAGPAGAPRPHDGNDTTSAQPPRAASDSRSAVNGAGRPADSAWALVFASWLIASASTLGALFFSEVMELPPCVLCWYQRIFMFPLVLVLPFGLFPFDRKIVRYALPLAGVGWLFAVFHLLLVAGIIPERIGPCTQGVPCSDVQIEWLGFVSIPLLSFVAFFVIGACLIAAHFRMSK